MRPQAPYQLPLAYIFKWSRSLTSPVSEAGLSVPPKPPTSLTADDRHVGVAGAPVNICEKKKGWSSRNGPQPHGWLADIQRDAGWTPAISRAQVGSQQTSAAFAWRHPVR